MAFNEKKIIAIICSCMCRNSPTLGTEDDKRFSLAREPKSAKKKKKKKKKKNGAVAREIRRSWGGGACKTLKLDYEKSNPLQNNFFAYLDSSRLGVLIAALNFGLKTKEIF